MILALAFAAAVLVVGMLGFVAGAAAAHRRHYLPSYRERWQQACRINERQYEALEQAVNALETADSVERGQAMTAARLVMRARINKDWDAKAAKAAKNRLRREISPSDLALLRKRYSSRH